MTANRVDDSASPCRKVCKPACRIPSRFRTGCKPSPTTLSRERSLGIPGTREEHTALWSSKHPAHSVITRLIVVIDSGGSAVTGIPNSLFAET